LDFFAERRQVRWDWLAIHAKALEVTADRILRHGASLFKRVAFGT
jgi:hypothetical protein